MHDGQSGGGTEEVEAGRHVVGVEPRWRRLGSACRRRLRGGQQGMHDPGRTEAGVSLMEMWEGSRRRMIGGAPKAEARQRARSSPELGVQWRLEGVVEDAVQWRQRRLEDGHQAQAGGGDSGHTRGRAVSVGGRCVSVEGRASQI
jgi:hypothetical protein